MRRLVTTAVRTAVVAVVVAGVGLLPGAPAGAAALLLGPELVLPPGRSDYSLQPLTIAATPDVLAVSPTPLSGDPRELWVGIAGAAPTATTLSLDLAARGVGVVGTRVWWKEQTSGQALRSYDVVTRATTRLVTDEFVVGVVRDGWVGYPDTPDGRVVLHTAAGPVVLATGVVGTPQLLATDGGGLVMRVVVEGGEQLLLLEAGSRSPRVVDAAPSVAASATLTADRIAWMTTSGLRVQPRSGGATRQVPSPGGRVTGLTTGYALVDPGNFETLVVVDLAATRAPLTVTVPGEPRWIGRSYAVGESFRVVLSGDATRSALWTLDPSTGSLTRGVPLPLSAARWLDADLSDGVLRGEQRRMYATGQGSAVTARGLVTGTSPRLGAARSEPLRLSDVYWSAARGVYDSPAPEMIDRGAFGAGLPWGIHSTRPRLSGPVAVADGTAWWADGSLRRPGVVPSGAKAWALADGVLSVVGGDGRLTHEDLLAPRGPGNPRAVGLVTACADTCGVTFQASARHVAYWAGDTSTGSWRSVDPSTGAEAGLGRGPGPSGRLRLGDGFVAATDPATGRVVVTSLDDPAAAPVTAGTGTLLDADGSAVVWLGNDGALHVRDVVAPTAPKSLGVIAAAGFSPNGDGVRDTWAPQLDATKPLTAVTVTIRDAAGTVVRRLAGTAPDASVRDAVWDGRTDAGTAAPDGRYAWTLTARAADGSGALPPVGGTVGLTRTGPGFRPVTATRILDTRSGLGAPKAAVGPGQTLLVPVAGRAGVAADARAVVVTLVGVAPTATTVLTAGAPDGAATGSTLPLATGDVRSTLAVLPVDASGRVAIRNAAGSVHVVADLAGWFPAGADVDVLAPTRLLDTRSSFGGVLDTTKAGATVGQTSTDLTGRGPVPEGSAAALVTLTAVAPGGTSEVYAAASGDVTDGGVLRVVAPGRTTGAATLLGTAGGSRVGASEQGTAAHLLADVTAWFPAGGPLRTTARPTVLADTRQTGRPVAAGGSLAVPVAGRAGVPTTGVTAVVLSLAVPLPATGGYVALRPTGTARTGTSNLDVGVRTGAAGIAVVPLGPDGSITLDSGSTGPLDVQVGVLGWFTG